MILDFHTHIFPDAIAERSLIGLEGVCHIKPSTDGKQLGLISSMDQAGVEKSVVLPVVTKPSQFESVNRFAVQVNETHGDRLISFGGIHPDGGDYRAELKQIRDMGLLGIKLHPDYQHVMIDDIRNMRIIDYANELGLIVVTHAGVDVGYPEPVHCSPEATRRMLDQVRPEKMVLAHMGGWKMWDQVLEYLVGQNVYLDTAFCLDRSREGKISQEKWQQILDGHDHSKILFASDSPWSDVRGDIAGLMELVPDEKVREDIFWNNGQKLLYNK